MENRREEEDGTFFIIYFFFCCICSFAFCVRFSESRLFIQRRPYLSGDDNNFLFYFLIS